MHKIPYKYMGPYEDLPPADPRAVQAAEQLCSKIKAPYPGLEKAFATKYRDWVITWSIGLNPYMAVPNLKGTPEFRDLVKMGPKITPFVVYKLTLRNYAYATSLYNEIEKNSKFRIDRDNVLDWCALERHANLVVDMNYERFHNAEDAVKKFKASMQKYCNHDTALTDCADDDGFKGLAELGDGAIAHIMMEWKTNSDEQENRIWAQVMKHIVYGPSSGQLGSGLGLWEDWKDWNENRDYDDAP